MASAPPAGMPFDARELGESDDFVEYWLHLTLEPEELPPGGDLREALQARCAVCMAYARQCSRTGHEPQLGDCGVQTVAPSSISAWL